MDNIDWNDIDWSIPVRRLSNLTGWSPSYILRKKRELRGWSVPKPKLTAEEKRKTYGVSFPPYAWYIIEAEALKAGLKPNIWIKRAIMEHLGLDPTPEELPDLPRWILDHSERVTSEDSIRYYIYRNAALTLFDPPAGTTPDQLLTWGVYLDAVTGDIMPGNTKPELYEAFINAFTAYENHQH